MTRARGRGGQWYRLSVLVVLGATLKVACRLVVASFLFLLAKVVPPFALEAEYQWLKQTQRCRAL